MTRKRIPVIGGLLVLIFAMYRGNSIFMIIPILVGIFFPDIDSYFWDIHRSWIFHTLLPSTIIYRLVRQISYLDESAVHFFSIGILLHLFYDYIISDNMDHDGKEWPISPTFGPIEWGFLWLSISWAIQWFLYIVPFLFPWIVKI